MKASDIKTVLEREPFRPFALRLSNGAQYNFTEPRDFGGTRDGRMIFYFGENQAVRIDAAHIVEVIEKNGQ